MNGQMESIKQGTVSPIDSNPLPVPTRRASSKQDTSMILGIEENVDMDFARMEAGI